MNKNSIGDRLRVARNQKDYTLDFVSNSTKIRKEYLEDIEKDNFAKFSSHVYAKGFIKNYAKFLGLDEKPLIAIYRRDFENFEIKRIPKKDTEEIKKKPEQKKLNITQKQIKIVLLVGVVFFVFIVLLQLINNAFKPPYIKITDPIELSGGQSQDLDYYDKTIIFKGEVSPYTFVKINEIPLTLKTGQLFESEAYPITSDDNLFIVTATNQIGVSSSIKINVHKKDNSANGTGIGGDITVMGDQNTLTVTADGTQIYTGQLNKNDTIPFSAKTELDISTSDPQNLKVNINNIDYALVNPTTKFTFANGQITQE